MNDANGTALTFEICKFQISISIHSTYELYYMIEDKGRKGWIKVNGQKDWKSAIHEVNDMRNVNWEESLILNSIEFIKPFYYFLDDEASMNLCLFWLWHQIIFALLYHFQSNRKLSKLTEVCHMSPESGCHQNSSHN